MTNLKARPLPSIKLGGVGKPNRPQPTKLPMIALTKIGRDLARAAALVAPQVATKRPLAVLNVRRRRARGSNNRLHGGSALRPSFKKSGAPWRQTIRPPF